MPSTGFRLATQGQSLTLLSLTSPDTSAAVPVFLDAALGTQLTLPYVVAGDQTFFVNDGWATNLNMVVQQSNGMLLTQTIRPLVGTQILISPRSSPTQDADTVSRPFSFGPADYGLQAWSTPFDGSPGGSTFATAGTTYLTLVKYQGGVVTNLVHNVTAGGGTLTAGQNFGGLFSLAGTLLSATVDLTTLWGSTGWKLLPLVTPQTLAPGMYYAGFFYNGTTSPTLSRTSNSSVTNINGPGVAPYLRACSVDTGRTTSFATPFGAQTPTNVLFCVGLS